MKKTLIDGEPYPGQERYHNWEANQYREHYHPYRDYERSHHKHHNKRIYREDQA
jgi:hypothetical protein